MSDLVGNLEGSVYRDVDEIDLSLFSYICTINNLKFLMFSILFWSPWYYIEKLQLQERERAFRQMKPRHHLNERLGRVTIAEGASTIASNADDNFCMDSLIAHMHRTFIKTIGCVTGVTEFLY